MNLKRKKQTKVTLALLYEEYKDANPNNCYGVTQFRNYYSRFANSINPSMKIVHISGEKVFVDYSGLTIPIVNQRTGEITKAQIFVAVLGASGYTYVHATYSQKQRDFILSHTLAYDFFGGTPLIVVPDNLKSAVIKHSKKDGIVINESYAALARHYNMVVRPARPYKPKDKAKVELGVKGIQRWILASLRHQTFFSVTELNDAISLLLDHYNNKIVKRFNKSRTQMFDELDKPFLQALPQERYVYREYKEATVSQSYHIFLEGAEYSVPFKYLGLRVFVAYSSQSVAIFYKGVQIALHPKLHFAGSVSTLNEHMPKNHEYAK
ncbi:MAG: IS21 family transposase [Aliarcobacter sp.]|nr:IS21 family transposase [Aliarcobacter sp.]